MFLVGVSICFGRWENLEPSVFTKGHQIALFRGYSTDCFRQKSVLYLPMLFVLLYTCACIVDKLFQILLVKLVALNLNK
jgi:hypothetical protein